MNPDEIIKAAPELLKHGAELVGALKLTEIAKAMLGPATGEFAERVRDEIRLYRFGRQLELLKKAEKMVQDAGFTPKAVPIKLLFPLLEGASLEEDEDLHTMWAALLANAASLAESRVRPSFPPILREMAPDEARLLNWFFDNVPTDGRIELTKLLTAPEALGWSSETTSNPDKHLLICLDSLAAFELIRRSYYASEKEWREWSRDEEPPIPYFFVLTQLGRSFVEASRPPKPKS